MDAQSAVETARTSYVTFLAETFALTRQTDERSVAELLVLLNADPSLCLRRLVRIDIVTGGPTAPHLIEARTDQPTRVDAHLTIDKSLDVEIQALLWHDCTFWHNTASRAETGLERWFTHWLDENDTLPAGPDGLTGVVHSVTRPQRQGELTTFSVDFGSAPAAAFWDLLGALATEGVSQLRVAQAKPYE